MEVSNSLSPDARRSDLAQLYVGLLCDQSRWVSTRSSPESVNGSTDVYHECWLYRGAYWVMPSLIGEGMV